MKLFRSVYLALPAAFVTLVCVAAPTTGLGPTLDLTYPAPTSSSPSATATCEFATDTSGVNVSGGVPGTMTASGTFGAGCPTAGIVIGSDAVNVSTPVSSASVGDTMNVSWTATEDSCTYDNQTALAASLGTSWPSQGPACSTASACGLLHSVPVTFPTAGTYTFGLTCRALARPNQTKSATATVTVTGGTTPPSTTCVAPPGLTRQLMGTIATADGTQQKSQADMTHWNDVLGINWSTNKYYGWPGIPGNGSKVYIKNMQYLSLEFTVPSNYPIYSTATFYPYGTIATNWSAVTNGVHYAVSISKDCGDFMQPASSSDLTYKCYREYTTNLGSGGIAWAVTLPSAPVTGMCNLTRGQSYYLNIIAAPLNDPTNSNCPGNSGASCKQNFLNGGSFPTGPLLP